MSQDWNVDYCDIEEKIKKENLYFPNREGATIMGFCDVEGRSICIEKNMSDSAKAEVLSHEIFHALFSVLPHNMDLELDEQIARFGAAALLDLYINNKLDWIKK